MNTALFITLTIIFGAGLSSGGIRRRSYCPKRSNMVCFVAYNECCCDDDCKGDGICCQENCGNTCHSPVPCKSDGEKVDESLPCEMGIVGGQTDFCPPKENIFCVRASNQCCQNSDCCEGQICCQENCGNTCRDVVHKPTNGTEYIPRDDSQCTIDGQEIQ